MTSPGAQVSGPGAYAKRTDTGGQPIRALPDPEYGQAQAYEQQQQAAPLSASADANVPQGPYPSDVARSIERAGGPAPAAVASAPEEPLPGLFDMGDASIPMTSGAPIGPGPNSLLPTQQDPATLRAALEPYFAADSTGTLATLANKLSNQGLW